MFVAFIHCNYRIQFLFTHCNYLSLLVFAASAEQEKEEREQQAIIRIANYISLPQLL